MSFYEQYLIDQNINCLLNFSQNNIPDNYLNENLNYDFPSLETDQISSFSFQGCTENTNPDSLNFTDSSINLSIPNDSNIPKDDKISIEKVTAFEIKNSQNNSWSKQDLSTTFISSAKTESENGEAKAPVFATVVKEKQGRISKKNARNLPIEMRYKSKMRSDNVNDKIKTHFFKFLFDFVNAIIRKYDLKIFNISRSLKDKIKIRQFKSLKIGEILQIKNQKRKGKDEERNYNKELFEKLKLVPEMQGILPLNLLEFFVGFYKNSSQEKIEKEFGLKLGENGVKLNFISELYKDDYAPYNEMIEKVVQSIIRM